MVRSSFLPLLFLPFAAHAAETCPVINAATAGGILGAAVTLAISHETANRDDMVCIFRHDAASIRVEVRTMDTPRTEYAAHAAQCGADPVALKATGNEAVVCMADAHTARVIGRVRNRLFAIAVSTPDATPEALREKARTVAGHVAGNLF